MGKKSLIALGLAGVLSVAAVVVLEKARIFNVSELDFSGQSRWLSERTFDFLEDLQFKDFDKAAIYHLAETQEARDIPFLIRKVFGVKHEILDIQNYEVQEVDMDRSGERARVRADIHYRILGDQAMTGDASSKRKLEMLFYWFKQSDGQWAMELESSLRSPEQRKEKK